MQNQPSTGADGHSGRLVRFLRHPLGLMAAAVTATLLWGSAFPFVKLGYAIAGISERNTFLQLEFAGYRFTLAALLLMAVGIFIARRNLAATGRQLLFAAKIGSVQTFLQYTFFYIGLGLSSGISASVIAGSLTFFQLGLAHFIYHDDRITATKVIAALVGFSGIVFYQTLESGLKLSFGAGELFMLAAMFCGALGNVLYRKAPAAGMFPLQLTALQMLMGGTGLTVVGALKVGFVPFHFSGSFVLILLYLSMLSATSFLIWNSIMTNNKAGGVSVYLFLIPIFGVILSALVLHEQLKWFVFPALALIAVSIIVTQRTQVGRRG
ncbi:MAG: DMT family transporter [Acidihalobacter sp.]